MAVADPKPSPEQSHRRPRLASIRAKLEGILYSENRSLHAYRVEVVSILETLDSVNRDARVIQTRGHLGDADGD